MHQSTGCYSYVAASGTIKSVAACLPTGANWGNGIHCRITAGGSAIVIAIVPDVILQAAMRTRRVDPVRALCISSRQAYVCLVESQVHVERLTRLKGNNSIGLPTTQHHRIRRDMLHSL